MTIKAILDTNVVISGIFWKGPPFRVLEAWQEQRFRLVISVPILEEYRRVLAEMAGEHFSPVLHSILGLIELHSEMVEPISLAKAVCNDPDDDKFIEAAVAAAADYVVSGDTALLRLKDHRGIRMVKPAEFLRLLRR
ncbi:MAG TPA: putative toxin-antitoxin system toxin component, PIN family [Candidatus Acidoferrales bacterium]|nr:putative toxin-antitoxin system toxin component, PIN family [Candidatus Acidoferrales bacterium]